MFILKNQNTLKLFNFKNFIQFLVLSIPALLITGPFLPDLFLTLSSISFFIYLFLNRNLKYLNNKVFYLFLFFFCICVFSSIFSDYQSRSIITSLAYIRFGLFIFVVKFLIDENEHFINNLSNILFFIFIIFLLDSIFQKFSGTNIFGIEKPYGRVSSFFGDDIKLGGYITRFTPLLIATTIYLNSSRLKIISILLISIILSFISGERTSFFMLLIFLVGFLLYFDVKIKLKIYLLLILSLFFISVTSINEEIRIRILKTTINQINFKGEEPFFKTIKNSSGDLIVEHRDTTFFPRVYHMYFETAFKIFKDNILFGSGPRTYKYKSKEDEYYTVSDHAGWIIFYNIHKEKILKKLITVHKNDIQKISQHKKYKELVNNKNLINKEEYKDWLKSKNISSLDFDERIKDKIWLKNHGLLDKNYEGFTNISGVNSHPHNTYLQLLSETGLVGFFFILSFWVICIYKFFSNTHLYYKCLILGIVINLFPFMFTGNFFNNWLSILYFYPLGFLISKREYNF